MKPETLLIPPTDDDRRLRHVEIDGRYRLILWDTYTQSQPGRAVLGFAFWDSTDEREAPLFIGEDFGPSPLHAVDSDESVLALLTFLTYTPEDDSRFTARQREWYESSECDELSCNVLMLEEDATDDEEESDWRAAFLADLEDSE